MIIMFLNIDSLLLWPWKPDKGILDIACLLEGEFGIILAYSVVIS